MLCLDPEQSIGRIEVKLLDSTLILPCGCWIDLRGLPANVYIQYRGYVIIVARVYD